MTKIIIILSILFPSTVLAATTGLSQSGFDIIAEAGQVVSRELWVNNIDTVAQEYAFTIKDARFADMASIAPETFFLAAQKSQKVVLRFRMPEMSQKKFISLVGYDKNQSNSQMRVASGILLPVNFNVGSVAGFSEPVAQSQKHGTIQRAQAVVWGFDFFLLALFVYLRKRKYALKRLPIEIQKFLDET